MPNKSPRINVTFTNPDLFETVTRDAHINRRSISFQILEVLEWAYAEKKRQAELFNSQLLGAGKSMPVYETLTAEDIARKRAREIREQHGLKES